MGIFNWPKIFYPNKTCQKKPLPSKYLNIFSLGSELKKQTSVAEKQYWGLNKLFKSDEKEETVTSKK